MLPHPIGHEPHVSLYLALLYPEGLFADSLVATQNQDLEQSLLPKCAL